MASTQQRSLEKKFGGGGFNLLDLCRANAAVLYPQYPPQNLQVTISQTKGTFNQLFYVAIFGFTTDSDSGLTAPRLLESGPARSTVEGAIQAMLDAYLSRKIATVVNEQAALVERTQWKESEVYGYTFHWPYDEREATHLAVSTLSPSSISFNNVSSSGNTLSPQGSSDSANAAEGSGAQQQQSAPPPYEDAVAEGI